MENKKHSGTFLKQKVFTVHLAASIMIKITSAFLISGEIHANQFFCNASMSTVHNLLCQTRRIWKKVQHFSRRTTFSTYTNGENSNHANQVALKSFLNHVSFFFHSSCLKNGNLHSLLFHWIFCLNLRAKNKFTLLFRPVQSPFEKAAVGNINQKLLSTGRLNR